MPKVKDTGIKELEDYQPGATRDEVMASLRKVLVKPAYESAQTGASKSNSKEDNNNGKTN